MSSEEHDEAPVWWEVELTCGPRCGERLVLLTAADEDPPYRLDFHGPKPNKFFYYYLHHYSSDGEENKAIYVHKYAEQANES